MGTGSFSGGKERPVRDADPSPRFSVVGRERVELYLYSPYGPYGLYRASVPVQGWPLPLCSACDDLNSIITQTFVRIIRSDVGRDSSVSIANRYGMDGPGIEYR